MYTTGKKEKKSKTKNKNNRFPPFVETESFFMVTLYIASLSTHTQVTALISRKR